MSGFPQQWNWREKAEGSDADARRVGRQLIASWSPTVEAPRNVLGVGQFQGWTTAMQHWPVCLTQL